METGTVSSNGASTARTILWITFIIIPIAAGADKFLHLLTEWHKYLAQPIADLLPFDAHTFMYIVGIIEIIAGILVIIKPRIGGIVVGLWLIGIVINLLITGTYFDIAVRDAGLAAGAFALASLSK